MGMRSELPLWRDAEAVSAVECLRAIALDVSVVRPLRLAIRMPLTLRNQSLLATAAVVGALIVQGCATARSTPTVSQQGFVRHEAPTLDASYYSALDRGIVDEVNRVRTNPSRYASELQGELQYYRGNLFRRPEDESALETREGTGAVLEAIRVLRQTPPMSPLRFSAAISEAAEDHVRDQAPRGLMNHRGTDGSMAWDRVSRYGEWKKKISENMTFGPMTAQDVVAALVIDDGIADRGHRKNLLDPDVHLIGVACGTHKSYRVMCDMVQAGGFVDKDSGQK